jgi:signal transduction histidine kinase/CheY-like chemotaxis protein
MAQTYTDEKIKETIDRISHRRRMDTVRFTAWFVIFVGAVWAFLGMALGYQALIYTSSIAVIGSLAAALMVQTRYNRLGRCIWMLSGMLAVFFGCFIIDPAGHVDYMFAAMVGGAFLIFSLVNERKYIVMFAFLDIFFWLLQWILRDDLTQFRVIGEEIAGTYIVAPSMMTTFTVIMIEFGYFAVVANDYAMSIFKSNVQAEAALKTKSAFLANMSHEIRTPMNGVVGMIDIFESSPLNPEQKRTLKTMRESAYSLLSIIDDILDTSKIEAGQLTLSERRTEMLSSFESAVESMVPFADNKRVMLSFEFDPLLPRWIKCDSGRLRQIMLNLVSNAIKFSSKDDAKKLGEVRVSVMRVGAESFEIKVTDNGIGIDERSRTRIFQPFVQSEDQEQARYGGTGLGLTIVKQLVELMGGEISFLTEVGQGTTFTVHLPLNEPEDDTLIPDLSGIKVYGFVLRKQTATNISRYIRSAGADYIPIAVEDNLSDVITDKNNDNVLLIGLSGDDSAVMHEFARQAKLQFPEMKIISFSAHRSDLMRETNDQHKVVQWKPLLPTDLWRGIQAVTGRLAPEMVMQEGTEQTLEVIAAKSTRILVAEDNDINQIVIEKQLSQLGYTPKIVGDGLEALDEWTSGEYDLLLSDCHMPRLDGFGLAEKIRGIETKEKRKRFPIIAITANALIGEAERCYAAGMDDYLSKPVKLAELKETIERWE